MTNKVHFPPSQPKGRRAWIRPQVVRLMAGEAENGFSTVTVDGPFTHS